MTKYYLNGKEVKVGDKLKVVKTGETHDENGMGNGVKWRNCWNRSMNSAIGKVGTVIEVGESGVYFEEFSLGFPLNACEFYIEKVNGVDINGNPKQLNDSDLKPMQRAVLGDGRTAIITKNRNDALIFAFAAASSWCSATVEYDFAYLNIEELYDLPEWTSSILDFNERGPLIWKRQEVDIKLNELTEAVEQAEQEYRENMDASIAKVKAAKQALEEYKVK